MNQENVFYLLLSFVLFISACVRISDEPATDLYMTHLFSDHMVLQQEMPVPVWGTANPGGRITVRIEGQNKITNADRNGAWMVRLDPLKAGGPYEMKVVGKDSLVFSDVLVGEVWLGSGQSNMEMPLGGWGRVKNYEQEIAGAGYLEIRLLQVERSSSFNKEREVPSEGWKVCSPQNIPQFSATAYFFGRHLHRNLQVPVGLIHSSWGGTIVEAWTSAEALSSVPEFREELKEMERSAKEGIRMTELRTRYQKALEQWQNDISKNDRGSAESWYKSGIPSDGRKTMKIPTTWEKAGLDKLDGIVWFQKTVRIPAGWANTDLNLHLGPIDDVDSTWFNGVKIGGMSGWDQPRIYTVPAGFVKTGVNTIVVRVVDFQGDGGLWGKPDELKLEKNKKEFISVSGSWEYRIGVDFGTLGAPPVDPENPNRPALLSNAMIEPLIPYAIRGFIWYQGESNAGRAYQYRTLFPLLITDWRNRWEQGDIPFIFVQLANWMEREPEPSDHAWAELREAQAMTLSLPATGMAVAIDIGDAYDIHPKNKQEVGRRLALNALHTAYGRDVKFSGPVFDSMTRRDNRLILTFKHVYDGLTTVDGNEVKGFAIADEDRKFRWARADVMDDDVIMVWHPDLENPVAVRYAWAANPDVNLINSEGLPAVPFRTDDWPGVTKENR